MDSLFPEIWRLSIARILEDGVKCAEPTEKYRGTLDVCPKWRQKDQGTHYVSPIARCEFATFTKRDNYQEYNYSEHVETSSQIHDKPC